jgi:hypothetical protein
MRLLLIPVADALPAVQAHLARYPDDSAPPSPEEMRKLIDLTYRYVAVAEALRLYVLLLTGPPQPN